MREVLILLRFPFSVLLLPVAVLGLSLSEGPITVDSYLVIAAIHLLLYPASNGINSYWDRDTGPIGMLRAPPEPTRLLLATALSMEGFGLLIAWVTHARVGLLLFFAVIASHLYSHPRTRVKARGWFGWAWVAFFQGPVVFWAVSEGQNTRDRLLGALTAFVMIGAAYPLTQIYQHEQDARARVVTASQLLGVRGTLVFSAVGDLCLGFLLIWLFSAAPWWTWLTFVPVAVLGARIKDKASYQYAMSQSLGGAFGMLGFLILQRVV